MYPFLFLLLWHATSLGSNESGNIEFPNAIPEIHMQDTLYTFLTTCNPQEVGIETQILSGDTLEIQVTGLTGPISNEGLVAYFPLDENPFDPTLTLDRSGFNNHGTIYGTTLITDNWNNENCALHFDGQNDSIIIPNLDIYNSYTFSISLWFRKINDITLDGFDKLYTKGALANNRNFSAEIKWGDGIVPWDLQVNNAINDQPDGLNGLRVIDVVYDTSWHHMVHTVRQEGDSLLIRKLYLDGDSIGGDTFPGLLVLTEFPIYLGSLHDSDSYNRDLIGDLDEFRIYNRILSEEEIQTLAQTSPKICLSETVYETTCFPEETGTNLTIVNDTLRLTITSLAGPVNNVGLVGYYPMDRYQPNPGIAKDRSGYDIDGMVNNAAATVDSCGTSLSAYHFNTFADNITIPHHPIHNSLNMSIAFWFKAESNTMQTDFEKLLTRGSSSFNRTFSFELKKGDGVPPWDIQMNGNNQFNSDPDSVNVKDTVTINEWHLLVGTISYNGDTERALYLDATLIDKDTLPGKIKLVELPIYMGHTPAVPTADFAGDIDELRIFNRILTQAEISTLYQMQCEPLQVDTLICFGDSLDIGNTSYTEPGTYEVLFADRNGCDSLVIFNLDTLDEKRFILDTLICAGDSLEVNGAIYNMPVLGAEEVISGVGPYSCDSIVVINLDFRSPITGILDTTICAGEMIEVNGVVFDSTIVGATSIFHNIGPFGCDSILTINLTVLEEKRASLDTTICAGEMIFINGMIYDSTIIGATRVFTDIGPYRCDSTLTINLTVLEESLHFLDTTICQGQSLTVCGQVFSEEVAEVEVNCQEATQFDCDSTIFVTVLIDTIRYLLDSTLCLEDGLEINGHIYDIENPTGLEILPTPLGCDSFLFVDLNFEFCTSRLPSVITPNGDGINDCFIVGDLNNNPLLFPEAELMIFNRWGELVFKTETGSSYQNDWCGHSGLLESGERLPVGTYVYVFKPNRQLDEMKKGYVTILR